MGEGTAQPRADETAPRGVAMNLLSESNNLCGPVQAPNAFAAGDVRGPET